MGSLKDRLKVAADKVREGVVDALREGLTPLRRPSLQPIPLPVPVDSPRSRRLS